MWQSSRHGTGTEFRGITLVALAGGWREGAAPVCVCVGCSSSGCGDSRRAEFWHGTTGDDELQWAWDCAPQWLHRFEPCRPH